MSGQPIVFSPPSVTPDPEAAAALENRMRAVKYRPQNGFHRDTQQPPAVPMLLRRQAT